MSEQEPIKEEGTKLGHIRKAVARVRHGEWTMQQFKEYLDEVSAELEEKEAGIRAVEIPPGLEADFAEEQRVGYGGIENYNRGVKFLREYTEGGEDGLLDRGLETIRQGHELILEAMRINREERRRLDDIDTGG